MLAAFVCHQPFPRPSGQGYVVGDPAVHLGVLRDCQSREEQLLRPPGDGRCLGTVEGVCARDSQVRRNGDLVGVGRGPGRGQAPVEHPGVRSLAGQHPDDGALDAGERSGHQRHRSGVALPHPQLKPEVGVTAPETQALALRGEVVEGPERRIPRLVGELVARFESGQQSR